MRKIYTMMFVAALAFAGCTDNDEKTGTIPPPSTAALTVDVMNIKATSAIVSVAPADKKATYLMQLAPASEVTNDTAYAAGLVEKAQAASSLANVLMKGERSDPTVNLTPETEYCIFAVYVNEEGKCGTIAKKIFTTLSDKPEEPDEPDVPEGPFVIKTSNVRAGNFTINIEADPSVGNYYVGIVEAATAQSDFNSDKNAIAAALIEMEKGNNTDFTEVDNTWIFNGNGEVEAFNAWMLVAGEEHNIYVFGIAADGSLTTDVAVSSVALPAGAMTSETIDITVSDIAEDGAVVSHVVTDKHLPYFCECIEASLIEGKSDAEIVAIVAENYGAYMAYATALGDYEYDGRGYLEAGTKYYAVAFGYVNDAAENVIATTAVAKEEFTTTGGAEPDFVEVTFAFDVQVHALDNIDITVTPSDNSVTYIWDIISEANYNVVGNKEEGIADYVAFLYSDSSAAEVLQDLAAQGQNSFNYTGLAGETTYYVWAVAVDSKGTIISNAGVSQPFTTPAEERSEETVEVTYSKYYDGDELAAADPVNLGQAAGLAFLPTTVTTSAGAAHWYVSVYADDYTDPAETTDATIISALRNGNSVKDKPSANFLINWDKTVTILAVAEDADGKPGPVFRKKLMLEKSGVSPISDLIGPQSAAKRPAGMRKASQGTIARTGLRKAPLDLWMNRELRPASYAPAKRDFVSARIAAEAEASKPAAGKFRKR